MKKALKILSIILLVLILFRGSIFRMCVTYKDIGNRSLTQVTNQKLIDKIELASEGKTINLATIVEIANEVTCDILQFTFSHASSNPNELTNSKKANCVGYSALFNSIANYLIAQHNLQNDLKATHKIGHLNLLGMDLHQLFDSSFFKDHDYNEVVDLSTGEVVAIDASVSDYFWISEVGQTK